MTVAAVAKRRYAVLSLALAGVLVSGCTSFTPFGPPEGVVWVENGSNRQYVARLDLQGADFPWVRIPPHDAGVVWQDAFPPGREGSTVLYDNDCKQVARVDGVADRNGFVIADDGTVTVEHANFHGTTGRAFTSHPICALAAAEP